MRSNDAADYSVESFADLPLFAPESRGPFGDSDAKPSPEELMVGSLIWKHRGRSNPISIARLRELTGYGERQIKGLVEQLVITHRMRIGGSRQEPAGYFIVQDAADLAAAVEPYKSQILSMLRRLRVLDAPHARREFLGQIRLELEG